MKRLIVLGSLVGVLALAALSDQSSSASAAGWCLFTVRGHWKTWMSDPMEGCLLKVASSRRGFFTLLHLPRAATLLKAKEYCAQVEEGETSFYTSESCATEKEGVSQFEKVYWTAEWLVDGGAITGEETSLSVDTNAALELTDLKVPLFGETTIKCEGIFHGVVFPEGGGEITEVLSKTGKVNELVCAGIKGACGTGTEAATVTPVALPWGTPVEKTEAGVLLLKVGGAKYHAVCKSSGLADECEADFSAKVSNTELGTVQSEFILKEQEENKEELGSCTQGGAESGHTQGTGTTSLTGTESGLALAVS
jgi:hypothetical protein